MEEDGRRFGLDLYRAVAIVLVLLSHGTGYYGIWSGAAVPTYLLLGGFLGVDLFFVLSGFLVGRILLRDAADPGPGAWRRFLVRRWLRTLPLYAVTLAVLAWLDPPRSPAVLFLYATFTQNIAWPLPEGGWFGVSWSLSVEEWFYLLASAALIGAGRHWGRRPAVTATLLAFFLIPPIARSADQHFIEPDRHQVILFLDQIAFGVLLAACTERWRWPMRRALPVFAAGIALIWVFFHLRAFAPEWRGSSYRAAAFDVLAAGAALCVPLAARWHQAPALLAVPVRAISLRAYGLYLIHMFVLAEIGYWRAPLGFSPAASLAASALITAGLASASWRWLERPLLRLRPPPVLAMDKHVGRAV